MPSWNHEGIIELFRRDPELAAELLRGPLGVELPAFSEARIEAGTLTQLNPPELRADTMVSLRKATEAVLSIIVEVQLSEDPEKLFSWPAYATTARHRLRCPACVLVVTHDDGVANWAARPIPIGPGGTFQPLVLRPSFVPIVDDEGEARRAPELAVLSALCHGRGDVDTAARVALAAAKGARELDRDQFLLYWGLIQAALSEAARKAFHMLPEGAQFFYEPMQQSFDKGMEKGMEKGMGKALLDVLDARGLAVTDAQRERIVECTDLEVLTRWLRRAVTAASTDQLFA